MTSAQIAIMTTIILYLSGDFHRRDDRNEARKALKAFISAAGAWAPWSRP